MANPTTSSSPALSSSGKSGILDLQEQLGFYRKYHHDTTNVLIHVVFVPTILFSTLTLFTRFTLPGLAAYPEINIGTLGALGYGIFYTLLDVKFGLPSLLVLVAATLKLSALKGTGDGVAWLLFVVGWVVQFIGHGVFEGRAPALLDNLVQALVLAPFFVTFEVAHFLGYRREVLDEIDRKIAPELEAFHAAKRGKKAAKAN
ncbi:hypothetical protein DV495_003370 [Geotrichum candidum]|nr:hypothetical protein DV454_003428 [Geotrichum candidum]KAF5126636.1 hypothetical protein DV495_003370 [Geotrichum candidum]